MFKIIIFGNNGLSLFKFNLISERNEISNKNFSENFCDGTRDAKNALSDRSGEDSLR